MNEFLSLPPYAIVAAGMFLSLWLFAQLKADLRRLERRAGQQRREIVEACRLLTAASGRGVAASADPGPGSGANPGQPVSESMARRAQILRLVRNGERPDRIAAALGLPVSDVLDAAARAARVGA